MRKTDAEHCIKLWILFSSRNSLRKYVLCCQTSRQWP